MPGQVVGSEKHTAEGRETNRRLVYDAPDASLCDELFARCRNKSEFAYFKSSLEARAKNHVKTLFGPVLKTYSDDFSRYILDHWRGHMGNS